MDEKSKYLMADIVLISISVKGTTDLLKAILRVQESGLGDDEPTNYIEETTAERREGERSNMSVSSREETEDVEVETAFSGSVAAPVTLSRPRLPCLSQMVQWWAKKWLPLIQVQPIRGHLRASAAQRRKAHSTSAWGQLRKSSQPIVDDIISSSLHYNHYNQAFYGYLHLIKNHCSGSFSFCVCATNMVIMHWQIRYCVAWSSIKHSSRLWTLGLVVCFAEPSSVRYDIDGFLLVLVLGYRKWMLNLLSSDGLGNLWG